MQNISLSPGFKRVCPPVQASPFVASTGTLSVDHARKTSAQGRVSETVGAPDSLVDSHHTVFLASVFGRLVPVLGLLLALWAAIAWSIGWLGGLAG